MKCFLYSALRSPTTSLYLKQTFPPRFQFHNCVFPYPYQRTAETQSIVHLWSPSGPILHIQLLKGHIYVEVLKKQSNLWRDNEPIQVIHITSISIVLRIQRSPPPKPKPIRKHRKKRSVYHQTSFLILTE